MTPDAHGFYRYFEVPGLGHCYGGNGGQPTRIFEALQAWVEDGTVPDTVPIEVQRHGKLETRVLCPFPEKIRVRPGSGVEDSDSFYCSVSLSSAEAG